MQKHRVNQPISMSLLLMLIFTGIGVITAQKASAQVVVGVTGTVEWKPQGGRTFNRVSRNMTLRQGSLLRLSRGAESDCFLSRWTSKNLINTGNIWLVTSLSPCQNGQWSSHHPSKWDTRYPLRHPTPCNSDSI